MTRKGLEWPSQPPQYWSESTLSHNSNSKRVIPSFLLHLHHRKLAAKEGFESSKISASFSPYKSRIKEIRLGSGENKSRRLIILFRFIVVRDQRNRDLDQVQGNVNQNDRFALRVKYIRTTTRDELMEKTMVGPWQ
ncbi:uncharacterized protein LOC105774157 [Gossypium raimondii]|uniref:uncharacterized protein LOC105774157 n=1 Tax=Gossypium raimondii TaxID=29730 RepID=UPI00227A8EEC|nr:uncharacterized protein LOC105774157 [Gossypium raimondii]